MDTDKSNLIKIIRTIHECSYRQIFLSVDLACTARFTFDRRFRLSGDKSFIFSDKSLNARLHKFTHRHR